MRTTLSLTWFAASEMTMQRFERIIRECDYYPYVCSTKYVWPTSNVNELSQLFIEIAIHKQRALVERVNAPWHRSVVFYTSESGRKTVSSRKVCPLSECVARW